MTDKTGGPAFPHMVKHYPTDSAGNRITERITDGGMTLRDWLAGQAMAAILAVRVLPDNGEIASDAYRMADAMLAERKVTP